MALSSHDWNWKATPKARELLPMITFPMNWDPFAVEVAVVEYRSEPTVAPAINFDPRAMRVPVTNDSSRRWPYSRCRIRN